MSTPGPTLIVACPHCGSLHQRPTYATVSILSTKVWSDGMVDCRGPAEAVEVTRCKGCRGAFWTEDAAVVGQFDNPWYRSMRGQHTEDTPASWTDAPRTASSCDIDTLLEALPLADSTDRKLFVRLGIWHELNSPDRMEPEDPRWHSFDKPYWEAHGAAFRNGYGTHFRPNLVELMPLLDTSSPFDQLLLAEALRELGRHYECLAALAGEFAGQHRAAADQIRRRAKARRGRVQAERS